MRAGNRQWLIQIERKTSTTDGYGGEVDTWTPFITEWAAVNYGTGNERRVAAQESATLTATFRIRDSEDARSVGPLDRISFDLGVWDIVSSVPYGREGRDITATRAA